MITLSLGASGMRSIAIAKSKEHIANAIQEARAINPSIIFLFATPSLFQDENFIQEIKTGTAGTKIVGCSTAGEISSAGVLQDSFSLLAIAFETTEVRTVKFKLAATEDSYFAGEGLGESLKGPKLKAVFVLGPGTNVNGTSILEGLIARLGKNIMISGGLAADKTNFCKTFTLCDGSVFDDHAVAVGLYGDDVSISCGSEGGWRPFGPARRVTKAVNNILYELDNKPALQLYKQYLGDKARFLPASGLSYPFAILRADRTTSGVIRSALAIDHEKESLIMAGNIEQGCQVCLMHADTGALTQGAAQAAAEALRTHEGPEENGCALIASCVGRLVVYGIDVDDEVEAVVDSFLPGTPLAGFYAYGEICSYTTTGRAELHNQTMTITYITERKGDA